MRKGKNKKGFRGGGQKKETDFTKEEMRQMIAKEESKILKSLGTKGAITTILAMFGIANF